MKKVVQLCSASLAAVMLLGSMPVMAQGYGHRDGYHHQRMKRHHGQRMQGYYDPSRETFTDSRGYVYRRCRANKACYNGMIR